MTRNAGVKAKPTFFLKDRFFNDETVAELGSNLQAAWKPFPLKRFQSEVLAKFPNQELKQRIHWIVTVLNWCLPERFPEALKILRASLPPPLDPSRTDDDFGSFIWVVPGEYVARYGCTETDLDNSLAFLGEATQRFSSESAIRPFLKTFPDQTMAFVHRCAEHDNYHVRRLASEGIRPFLPWAERVVLPVNSVIEVLDRLHADSTRYVTRSVANTLNDLSRLDADAVLATLGRWCQSGRQGARELDWMTRHALRTLMKQNHAAALALLGFAAQPLFNLMELETSEEVPVGDEFIWRCVLHSEQSQKLKVALRVGFLKANGSHSSKVFAVHEGALSAGQRLKIAKRVSFRPITTRVLYPGTHFAELVVNGVGCGRRSFELIVG